MKTVFAISLFIFVFSLGGNAFADGKSVTQKYEIVCLKCMAKHAAMGDGGGHGEKHAACAMSCATKGMDLGAMDPKGNLYCVVNSDFTSARDVIKDKAGQTVELTGTIVKTKGINYLELSDSGAK